MLYVDLLDPGDVRCWNRGDVVRANGVDLVIVSLTDRGAWLRPLRWYERAWRWLVRKVEN